MKAKKLLSLVMAVIFVATAFIAAAPLTVHAANMISIEKTTYAPGESIAISVIDSSQLVKGYSIIFLYNAGAKHGDWIGGQWRYYDGTTFPAFNAPNTLGNYEIRLYLDSGGDKYSDATCVTTLSFTVSDGSTPTPTQPTGGKGWYLSHEEYLDATGTSGSDTVKSTYDGSTNTLTYAHTRESVASFSQQTVWSSDPPGFIAAKTPFTFTIGTYETSSNVWGARQVLVGFASCASKSPPAKDDYYASATAEGHQVVRPGDGAKELTITANEGSFEGQRAYFVIFGGGSDRSNHAEVRYHYVWRESETVTPPVTPPGNQAAAPTSSKVLVNGIEVAFDAYNIGGNNYFKLRDIAYVLSGSNKQFEVNWDGANNAISLTSGKSYSSVGGEIQGKGSGNKTASPTSSKIYLDGSEVQFTAYNIEGNNYFKLRDIGEAFDFNVSWDGTKNTIIINTSESYTLD